MSELAWTADEAPKSVFHGLRRGLKRLSQGRRAIRVRDVERVCGRGASVVLRRAHASGRVERPFTVSLVLYDGCSVDLEFQDAAQHQSMLQGFTRLVAAARTLSRSDSWDESVSFADAGAA